MANSSDALVKRIAIGIKQDACVVFPYGRYLWATCPWGRFQWVYFPIISPPYLMLSWHRDQQVLCTDRFVSKWWLGHSPRSISSDCADYSLLVSMKQEKYSLWLYMAVHLCILGNPLCIIHFHLFQLTGVPSTKFLPLINMNVIVFSLILSFVFSLLSFVFLLSTCTFFFVRVLLWFIRWQSFVWVAHTAATSSLTDFFAVATCSEWN